MRKSVKKKVRMKKNVSVHAIDDWNECSGLYHDHGPEKAFHCQMIRIKRKVLHFEYLFVKINKMDFPIKSQNQYD